MSHPMDSNRILQDSMWHRDIYLTILKKPIPCVKQFLFFICIQQHLNSFCIGFSLSFIFPIYNKLIVSLRFMASIQVPHHNYSRYDDFVFEMNELQNISLYLVRWKNCTFFFSRLQEQKSCGVTSNLSKVQSNRYLIFKLGYLSLELRGFWWWVCDIQGWGRIWKTVQQVTRVSFVWQYSQIP